MAVIYDSHILSVIHKDDLDETLKDFGIKSESVKIIKSEGILSPPGFIDVHVHGSAGVDVMDGSERSIKALSSELAAHGGYFLFRHNGVK